MKEGVLVAHWIIWPGPKSPNTSHFKLFSTKGILYRLAESPRVNDPYNGEGFKMHPASPDRVHFELLHGSASAGPLAPIKGPCMLQTLIALPKGFQFLTNPNQQYQSKEGQRPALKTSLGRKYLWANAMLVPAPNIIGQH